MRHRNYNVTRKNNMGNDRVPSLEAINRPVRKYYRTDELTGVYFYINLVGNLGLKRRSLIQDVSKKEGEMVLNYNQHQSQRAGISQIICPNEHVEAVVEGVKFKKIIRLLETYNPLELSARSKHRRKSRKEALKSHQLEGMRNWQRCERSPKDEKLAQYFELLLERRNQNSTRTGAENQTSSKNGGGSKKTIRHTASTIKAEGGQ